jgi:hypothetical protein
MFEPNPCRPACLALSDYTGFTQLPQRCNKMQKPEGFTTIPFDLERLVVLLKGETRR